jgi:adenosylcobinamide-GDP ribazoletransferase
VSGLLQAIRHYLLAVQFFTRVPVTGRLAAWVGFSPQMLRASAAHFPGVGLLVGLTAAGVVWACYATLPAGAYQHLVAAALGTVATVLMTGAFHEDGLADVADGLGGSLARDQALLVMKDSRLGSYGTLALGLALLCKISLLALLGETLGVPGVCCALLAAHVVSRFFPLLLIRALPHIGDLAGSKSKPLAGQISGGGLWVAGTWAAAGLIPLAGTEGLDAVAAVVAAAALAFGWMWRLFYRRLQGFTGDCLGATQQVAEIACYLGLAWSLA